MFFLYSLLGVFFLWRYKVLKGIALCSIWACSVTITCINFVNSQIMRIFAAEPNFEIKTNVII